MSDGSGVRLTVTTLMVLGCLVGLTPSRIFAAARDYELLSIRRLTDRGGRVDWSPDGQWIAFDRKGDDGLYDVWLMRPDGSDERCLTEDGIGLPRGRQIGQPAFHPSGRWLVMQVEKESHHKPSEHPHPGTGLYHDLWVMDLTTKTSFRLTDVRSTGGLIAKPGGSLHPVFSHTGDRLLWTDHQSQWAGADLVGDWQLALADFVVGSDGEGAVATPRLQNVRTFDPGPRPTWFESHGWGPDDSWIYFSGNTAGGWFLYADINRMVLAEAPKFQRLTRTGGPAAREPGHYDEHAHFTRTADAFLWLRSIKGRSEYWMADADGSSPRQVTNFNTHGHPHNALVRGLRSCPSDNAWNPRPPEGREQLVAYVQVDFHLLANESAHNEIFLLEFGRRP